MQYTEEQIEQALRWADRLEENYPGFMPYVPILAAALRDARAEKARLLDEAAERAVQWLMTLHHEPEPGFPWSDKIRRMQDLQVRTLIAAVRGKE